MDQTPFLSQDLYEALLIRMDLQQLKELVLDPATPPIGLVIFRSLNFWRLRAEVDFCIVSHPTDIDHGEQYTNF